MLMLDQKLSHTFFECGHYNCRCIPSIYFVKGYIGQGVASTEHDSNIGAQLKVKNPFSHEYFTLSYWVNAVIDHNKTYGDTNVAVWHGTDPGKRSFGFVESSGNHHYYHKHEYPELIVSDEVNNNRYGTSLYYAESKMSERTWQHVAVTYEKGNMNVYLNGIAIITDKITSTSPVGLDLNISLRGDDKLDQLLIYDRVLQASEIQKLYKKNAIANPM